MSVCFCSFPDSADIFERPTMGHEGVVMIEKILMRKTVMRGIERTRKIRANYRLESIKYW